MKINFSIFLLLLSIFSFASTIYVVNSNVLNVRSGPGVSYEIIGKLKLNEEVIGLSKQGAWIEIDSQGLKGYSASKFLSESNNKKNESKEEEEDGSSLKSIVILGVLIYFFFRFRKWLIDFVKGTPSNQKTSSKNSNTQKKNKTFRKGVVYKYTVTGNGTVGAIRIVEGMNVEVVVPGMDNFSSPWNTASEKIFIEQFIRKYNIDPSHNSSVKALFSRRNLEAEII